MRNSLIGKEILPFLMLFGSLLAATIFIDFMLHRLGLVSVGRWLGIPGTGLIVLSFVYSLRKRRLIRAGRPASMLRLHEVLAWVGSLLILVHAGIHVYTVLPWLALLAMLINVASGLTGTYLLARSRRFIADRRVSNEEMGLSTEQIEKNLFWDATSYDLMKRWRGVHMPITLVFAGLGMAHIVGILIFWGWD